MTKPQRFPMGWDADRVRSLIAHYDAQTEDEQAAEIEAVLMDNSERRGAAPAVSPDQARASRSRHRSS